jgi:hypothetical protein
MAGRGGGSGAKPSRTRDLIIRIAQFNQTNKKTGALIVLKRSRLEQLPLAVTYSSYLSVTICFQTNRPNMFRFKFGRWHEASGGRQRAEKRPGIAARDHLRCFAPHILKQPQPELQPRGIEAPWKETDSCTLGFVFWLRVLGLRCLAVCYNNTRPNQNRRGGAGGKARRGILI